MVARALALYKKAVDHRDTLKGAPKRQRKTDNRKLVDEARQFKRILVAVLTKFEEAVALDQPSRFDLSGSPANSDESSRSGSDSGGMAWDWDGI